MRSIWKGAVTFGLVNVPVKLYSALESHNVPLHQVHDADGGRIRYQRRCEVCGQVIPYEHIDKAFDDGEQTVVLTSEDLASLPSSKSREIDVVEFVPSEQIDPVLFDRTYYLEPDSKSPKAYVLLRQTLEETERTAIVKFAMRERTHLAALRVRDGALTLQTLLWADEVRSTNFLEIGSAEITDKELKMSASLVESFSADFDPTQYVDEYRTELTKLIDAKLEEGDAIDTEATFGHTGEGAEQGEGAEVIDLMDALRRSVEKSRAAAKGTHDDADADATSESGEPGKSARKTASSATKNAKSRTTTSSADSGVAEPAGKSTPSAKSTSGKRTSSTSAKGSGESGTKHTSRSAPAKERTKARKTG